MGGRVVLDGNSRVLSSQNVSQDTDTARVVDAVEEAESKTSAEFVVALEPSSGSYRDVDLLFAIVFNFVALVFVFFGPIVFDPDWVPLTQSLLFVTAWVFSAYTPYIRRLFCPSARMAQQVREAAQLHFLKRGVSQTQKRTGVLVLVSQLEQRVEVVADSGIRRAVKDESWEALLVDIQAEYDGEDLVGTATVAVERLGGFLAEPLPVSKDDIDELSNMPVLH